MASRDEAVQMIRDRMKCSNGRAEALLERACLKDREVGWIAHRLRPGRVKVWSDDCSIDDDDLIDWLNRQAPSAPVRRRKRTKIEREVAEDAVKALYPRGVPSQKDLPNPKLYEAVRKKAENDRISDTTILRAAGRRRDICG